MKLNFTKQSIVLSLIFVLFACDPGTNLIDNIVDNDPVEVILTGSINKDTYTPGEEASCEVNRIPRSFDKFLEMYNQAALEPQGGAAMFIVALEMYRQNPSVGEKCLAHTVYHKNATDPNKLPFSNMHIIKDKLRGTDSYAQPYIPMAYYEGAVPANQYTPDRYKSNYYVPQSSNYSPLSSAQSYVIPLRVRAYGENWNHEPNRDHSVSVVRPAGEQYYLVFEYNDLLISILKPHKQK